MNASAKQRLDDLEAKKADLESVSGNGDDNSSDKAGRIIANVGNAIKINDFKRSRMDYNYYPPRNLL